MTSRSTLPGVAGETLPAGEVVAGAPRSYPTRRSVRRQPTHFGLRGVLQFSALLLVISPLFAALTRGQSFRVLPVALVAAAIVLLVGWALRVDIAARSGQPVPRLIRYAALAVLAVAIVAALVAVIAGALTQEVW